MLKNYISVVNIMYEIYIFSFKNVNNFTNILNMKIYVEF